jgi:tRNA-Thr(GGU) m(6)t(6)A37 methyltransferase TsaA
MAASNPVGGFVPIGCVRCPQYYRYEAARQAALAPDNEAIIELEDEPGYADALRDLDGFDRIWVIYEFHLNETWHPFVQPPREGMNRLGTFATRSPHRPNRIGISCVKLLEIDGLKLRIGQHDLLDKTPVLDLKPYLPYADAFPTAKAGWVDEVELNWFDVRWDSAARERAEWVAEEGGLDAINFAAVQLGTDPTDGNRKRVKQLEDGDWEISYRTFRLGFSLHVEERVATVTRMTSGYEPADLVEGSKDPHKDKDLHRAFLERYQSAAGN